MDLITKVDNKGNFTFVNKKSTKFLGLAPEKCVGLSAFDFVHPDDKGRTAEWFLKCAKQKQTQATIENRQINSQTNEVFNMLWTTNFTYDEQGNVLSNKAIGRDITDLRLANLEILSEQKKAQRYLDVAGVMFVALNCNGEVTLINKRGCEILNIKEDEALGTNWFDNYLPKRMVNDVKKVFDKLMEGEIDPVEYYENPIITSDNKERIIAFHNTLLIDKI